MITYSYYETLEQRPLILKHLQAYNLAFTGVRPSEDRYFYVVDGNGLKGAIYAHLGWDWITLSNIYYENTDLLQLLLAKVCLHFKDKASGISYDSDDMERLNDFYKVGFKNDGKIEKTPKTKEKHISSNTVFDIISDSKLSVIELSIVDDVLDKELKEIVKLEVKKNKTDLIFIASNNDEFVGGVHGEITEDRMYISLLVVSDKFKGKKIGSKLMDLIEDEAKSKGVVSVDLGTCDFQAKPFYEKRGYNVISVLNNYPKGFNEYNLVKSLK